MSFPKCVIIEEAGSFIKFYTLPQNLQECFNLFS